MKKILFLLLLPLTIFAQTQPRANQIKFTPDGNISSTNLQTAVQELDDEKSGKNIKWIAKTANYTPVAADTTFANVGFFMESATDISFTIPSNLTTNFNNGTTFRVQNGSTGTLSLLEAASVEFKCIVDGPWTLDENEYAVFSKVTSNIWTLTLFKKPNLSTETTIALYTEYVTIGNVTTGEDQLFSYTLDGGTMSTDGNIIRGKFSGIMALNSNDKILKLKFGGTTVVSRTQINTPDIGQGWVIDYEVIRTSDSTQRISATFVGIDGIGSSYYVATTEDLTGDVNIVLTGEAVATDDILMHTATGTFLPGAGGTTTPPPIIPPDIPFVAVDNAVQGTDGYEHTYVGTWPSNSTSPLWYANTQTNSGVTNDYFEMDFNGTKVEWYTEKAPHLGIAAVSIDGGAETNVDLYSATATQQVKVWESITTADVHTVKVRVTGTKNGSSSATYIGHDYFKVINPEDVPLTPDVGSAQRYVATNGVNSGNCSVTPCLTLTYTVTQATSGDLIQMGPGTFVEPNYVSVPLNVDIRGSGIDVTILKGASGLWDDWDDYGWEFDKSLIQYVSGSPGATGSQYIKDLTIDGTGTAYNDGTGPTHPVALNDRGMYGGIYILNRDDIIVDGIKVRKCFLTAIFIENTDNTKILNSTFIDNAYGQTQFATGNVMWGGSVGNTALEIANNTVNEGFGNGMKAFGPPPTKGMVTFDIHGDNISVVPTGQWNAGNAPNIAFENWGVTMVNCLLHDNYFDANISLVNNEQDDDAVNTIHMYNNKVDMLARGAGAAYCVELSVSYAEFDHNYFIGGRFGTFCNFQAKTYPTLSSKYGFWNVHQNVVLATQEGSPSMFIRGNNEALYEVTCDNNTFEIDDYAGDANTGHKTWCLLGSVNNTGSTNADGSQSNVNITARNNVVWDKSNGTSSPFANRTWYIGSNNTFTNVALTYNQFFSIQQTTATGITYSNNGTTDPQMNKTGVKPDPYYKPTASGNLDGTGTSAPGYGTDKGAYTIP